MGRILFFEDEDEFAARLKKRLSQELGPAVKVELAKTNLSNSVSGAKSRQRGAQPHPTFVHRLLPAIRKYGNIDLIVTDVNLSEIASYEGLSAEVVGEVGRRLFIPVCVYSRNVPSDFQRIQESVDARIKLSSNPQSPEMLKEIAALYNGFMTISRLYNKLSRKQRTQTLSQTLVTILDKPHYVDRVSLYGLGNQAFLELTPMNDKAIKSDVRSKNIPYLLGRWLLGSIMKFPGLLVNEIAAASHLNISLHDFKNPNVKRLFKSAKYEGPFHQLQEFWWRYELDATVERAKSTRGLDLVRKKVGAGIKPCKCSVDPTLDAGYYCIVNHVPVSLNKSTSEISWIPKGADLARVSIPVYNKLKPWIGIL